MTDKILVSGVQCRVCRDILISRWRHDCHACSCDTTLIDGGRDYMVVRYLPNNPPIHVNIELVGGLTTQELAELPCLGRIKSRHWVYPVLFRYTLNRKGKFYRYPKH